MPGISKSPFFVVGLCGCYGTSVKLRQVIYNSVSVFTSYWHRASRSSTSESVECCHFFPGNLSSPNDAHSPMHMCGVLDTLKYTGTFQSPQRTSYSQSFLFTVLFGRFFVIPTCLSLPQAAAILSNCCLLFLTSALREKAVCTNWSLYSIK